MGGAGASLYVIVAYAAGASSAAFSQKFCGVLISGI
jgi:hypothetical protein